MDTGTAIVVIASVLALTSFATGIFLATRRRWVLAGICVAAGVAAAIALVLFLTPMP